MGISKQVLLLLRLFGIESEFFISIIVVDLTIYLVLVMPLKGLTQLSIRFELR